MSKTSMLQPDSFVWVEEQRFQLEKMAADISLVEYKTGGRREGGEIVGNVHSVLSQLTMDGCNTPLAASL